MVALSVRRHLLPALLTSPLLVMGKPLGATARALLGANAALQDRHRVERPKS